MRSAAPLKQARWEEKLHILGKKRKKKARQFFWKPTKEIKLVTGWVAIQIQFHLKMGKPNINVANLPQWSYIH
jgi:hypothetical protein